MKKKLLLSFILMSFFAYNASAYKIIISGGGKKNRFQYIEIADDHCYCRGVGNNECPVSFRKPSLFAVKTWFTMNEIVEYVNEQVKLGNTTGETVYGDELPVKWVATGDDNLEIDIESKDVRGIEN
jgi:hypothetical protein